MKCSLGIYNFLEEISCLSHSTVFFVLCIDPLGRFSYLSLLFFGTLHSHDSHPQSFSPLPFTSVLFSAICKAFSDNHFAFLHFFFLGMVSITTSCVMFQTSIQSSSGTLPDLIPWIYLSLILYNYKGFHLGCQLVKNPPAKQETLVWFLGRGDLLEKW